MEEAKQTEVITETQVKRLFSAIKRELYESVSLSNEENQFLQNCFNNKQFINFIKVDGKEFINLKEAFSLYRKNPSYEMSKVVVTQLRHLWKDYEFFSEVMHTTIQNLEDKYENIAKEKIQHLEKNVYKSDVMLGKQAGDENAQKYKNYAEKNRKSAQWLFWFSVAIMGSLSIFSAFALYFTDITSKDLFVRISLFFAILLPAFFMMRESKKLKDKEFQYTDMAYRIMTSEPYIDGLNLLPEEKAKLKAALVKDFFAKPIECRDDGGLPPIDNICEIIKTCLDSCRKD